MAVAKAKEKVVCPDGKESLKPWVSKFLTFVSSIKGRGLKQKIFIIFERPQAIKVIVKILTMDFNFIFFRKNKAITPKMNHQTSQIAKNIMRVSNHSLCRAKLLKK